MDLYKERGGGGYLIPVCVAVLAAFAVGLYFYRSGSADARQLIWRVSLDMIADRPLTGFGPGNFPRYYMLYQADWFRAHPDSEFAAVADNAVYPFNEYIKLAVETGIPDCETWCDLGQASEAAGEPGHAEEYYRTASFMIPTRLRPNYLLWKLYLDAGRNDDATRTARKILSMPLKVENTYTLRVKDEVREWLADRTGD